MGKGTTLSQLAAQRKLGFLGTLDKKLQRLRREAEKLSRAASDPNASGGLRSIDEIDRVTRGLVGAGPIYGVPAVTAWAKSFLTKIETLRRKKTPPSEDDFSWLATQIQDLEQLRDKEVGEAERKLSRDDTGKVMTRSSMPPPRPDSVKKSLSPSEVPGTVEPVKVPVPAPQPGKVKEVEAGESAKDESVAPTDEGLTIPVFVIADTASVRRKVVLSLTHAGFAVHEMSPLSSARELVQEEAPDLVVIDVDDDAPGGNMLVELLSHDPLTDFIPVLKLTNSKELPSSNTILKPIDTKRLVAEARRLTGQEMEIGSTTRELGELNLDDLTEFVSAEIRAGVLEAATGSHIRDNFQVIEKGPLVASVWALVARLRRIVAEGSQGKIRFRPTAHGPIGMMALDEADGVLDPASHEIVDDSDISALSGLSVVVVDDDVEIRTAFEKVLAKAGMKVRVASDGVEALAVIRKAPPDVVITDILMPKMDGWELTTRLRWDYSLKHIPLIMLSWKEDFLQRVRELNVGADGFMLKEVNRQQVLTHVAGVLKPRITIEQRLADEGVVTGRIERLGVISILRSAMGLRPDCRITVRENWNYFEADIKDGDLMSVSRTGTDGSFASGMPALERLLGVSSGRFSVIPGVDKAKKQFADGSLNAIREATARLNNLNSQVVDGALMHITKVEMNEEVVDVYSKVMPPKLRNSLKRLADGETPRNIVLDATASSETLEMLMLDLIHMGAIQGIVSVPPKKKPGEDSEGMASLPASEPSLSVPPPVPMEALGESPRDSSSMPLSLDDISEISDVKPASSSMIPPDNLKPAPAAELAHPQSVTGPASKSSATWKAIAALFFICFIVMAVLHFGDSPKKQVAALDPPPQAHQTAIPAPTPEIPPAPAPITPPAPAPETPSTPVAPAEQEAAPTEEPGEVASQPVDKYGETEEQRARRKARQKKKEEQAKATEAKKEEPKKKEPKKEEKVAAAPKPGTTGLLSIKVPPGVSGSIVVSVDGRSRGKAPLNVRLSSGLHEVVFTHNGKRTMRMVSMKLGQTKTIQAKVAQ
ncbi:MAG: response regulator [Deltaproteobacteria bacterium]|nr:response regulator [Deltaproteobacteria bacterium]